MRGDVHLLRARRGAGGHEQQGRSYGVVVQSSDLPLSTVLVAPTSRSAAPRIFRPTVVVAGQETQVVVEQTSAVDVDRLGAWVGHLTRRELSEVESALRLVLALD